MEEWLIEFLIRILFESIVADAKLRNNWIKYDFEDFRRRSQQSSLNFLRETFFLIGAFIMLIITCALCGVACMLSYVLRGDYYHRQQTREREELRILEERFCEAGTVNEFDKFD
uniref:Uncharacterized protein n=1 Tax=Onchocerca volvulus TaxID=6282 RepID=A0A8R1XZH0_ONCVO